jgi:hypothetical protein
VCSIPLTAWRVAEQCLPPRGEPSWKHRCSRGQAEPIDAPLSLAHSYYLPWAGRNQDQVTTRRPRRSGPVRRVGRPGEGRAPSINGGQALPLLLIRVGGPPGARTRHLGIKRTRRSRSPMIATDQCLLLPALLRTTHDSHACHSSPVVAQKVAHGGDYRASATSCLADDTHPALMKRSFPRRCASQHHHQPMAGW